PDVTLGLPVAVDAPFHLQRRLLPHQGHPIDLAMARRAADALVNVDAMVEIDEVRQIVNPSPLNGAVGTEALAHRLQEGTVRENLRVTVHARLGRRNAGKGGVLDRCVAIAAIDAVAADVA